MAVAIETLVELFESRGSVRGATASISQLEHALCCAHLAQSTGEGPEMIVSALLHDIGHLISDADEQDLVDVSRADSGFDRHHEYQAAGFLRGTFTERVIAPVRLHVEAKRYLCAVDCNYWSRLSDESKYSLELQGGPLTASQAAAFARKPYALAAVTLRRLDDAAQRPATGPLSLSQFVPLLETCAVRPSYRPLELVRFN